MDDIDKANNQAQMILDKQLQARRPVDSIKPRGYCHNPKCELDTKPNQLFCDSVCAREYEIYK